MAPNPSLLPLCLMEGAPCSNGPQAIDTAGKEHIVDCPSKLPPANRLESISEPYVR